MTQTALITGTSRGLGLALARTLAAEGWHLIINARGADALEAARAELAAHTQVTAISGDVTDSTHRDALATAARASGGLNLVVNNASILGPSPQPDLLAYPLEALEAVYRTNVIAPLGIIQAVKDTLQADATIINITSDAGVEAYPGWGGYGSSKAALEQLSAILAAENPAWRVYWVDPGDMRTQMHQEAFPGEDISDRPLPEESVPGLLRLLGGDYPSGRYNVHNLDTPANTVRELRLVLTTSDLNTTLNFYRDQLAMPVLDEWHEIGNGYLLDAGRARLELVDAAQAAAIDHEEVGHRSAGPVRLALEVDDIATLSAQLDDTPKIAGIVDTPWGHRNQRVLGPDGMQITLSQTVGLVEADAVAASEVS